MLPHDDHAANMFLNRKIPLRSAGILFESTELMLRPRSDSALRLDIKNNYQICMET